MHEQIIGLSPQLISVKSKTGLTTFCMPIVKQNSRTAPGLQNAAIFKCHMLVSDKVFSITQLSEDCRRLNGMPGFTIAFFSESTNIVSAYPEKRLDSRT